MAFHDQALATGSGFFWATGERMKLVTNWHNVAGRDPTTGRPISPTGGVPDRIRFTAYKRSAEEVSPGFHALELRIVEQLLYRGTPKVPLWTEHPHLGPQADVAAIDVTDRIQTEGLHCINAESLESNSAVEASASQDVFIIGYPLGLVTKDAPIPVWKRGTIATDPSFDPNGVPIIYVDSASRPGMSGSVALVRHIVLGKYPKKDGTTATVLYGRLDQVLGIYSGRLSPDNVQAQLGIIWKRHVIEETVVSGVAPAL